MWCHKEHSAKFGIALGLLAGLVGVAWGCVLDATPVGPTATPVAEDCSAYATAFFELDQTVAVLECAVADMFQTVQAERTRCASAAPGESVTPGEMTPTRPPEASPPHGGATQTSMAWLCRTCVKGAANGTPGGCVAGYECRNCYSAGYRCVRVTSPNSDCQLCQ